MIHSSMHWCDVEDPMLLAYFSLYQNKASKQQLPPCIYVIQRLPNDRLFLHWSAQVRHRNIANPTWSSYEPKFALSHDDQALSLSDDDVRKLGQPDRPEPARVTHIVRRLLTRPAGGPVH